MLWHVMANCIVGGVIGWAAAEITLKVITPCRRRMPRRRVRPWTYIYDGDGVPMASFPAVCDVCRGPDAIIVFLPERGYFLIPADDETVIDTAEVKET